MTQTALLALSANCAARPAPYTRTKRGGARAEEKVSQPDELAELLRRANAGDGPAFAQFLRRITPAIRTVIRAKGSSLPEHQHEDILQEVLLAIHLKRGSWKEGTPVKPWVYAITRYKVVDAFRRRGAIIHVPIEPFSETLEDLSAAVPLAGKDAEYMLSHLDGRGAALVRSMTLEGESAEDAGEKVGLSASSARVALHRALKQLARIAERTKN